MWLFWLAVGGGVLYGLSKLASKIPTTTSEGPRRIEKAVSVATVGAEIDQLDWTDPDAIMAVAERANDAGAVNTAKSLAQHAVKVRDIANVVEEARTTPLKSPLPDVSDEGWTAFMKLCRGTDVGEISPSYCLGLFNIGFLRLRELGLASDVKQGTYGDRTVWIGTLKPPMTMRRFLSHPETQYRVFVKDMADRTKMIRAKYADVIGKELEGVGKPTLSGLLAVAKLAGTKGFHGWVTDPRQRIKFKNTTDAFKASNGLF